jgi:hypothetical protein
MSVLQYSQEKLKIIQTEVQKFLVLTQELQTELALCQIQNQTLVNTNSKLQQKLSIIQQENNDLKQQLLKSQNQTICKPSSNPNQTFTSFSAINQPTFSPNTKKNHSQNQTVVNPFSNPNKNQTSLSFSNQQRFSLNKNQNHPQIFLHSKIILAMAILKEHRSDQNKLKEAFILFKEASDETKEPEACWRTAACYFKGIGVKQDLNLALEYSKISMEQGSIDGIFWHGRIHYCKDKYQDAYLYIHKAAKTGHLASIYFEGVCEYYGRGVQKNKESGKRKGLSVLESGDVYLTSQNSMTLHSCWFGISKNSKEAQRLKFFWKSQPISDFNYFCPEYDPWSHFYFT